MREMKNLLYSLICATLLCGCSAPKGIYGVWYASYHNSLVTIVLGEDSTISVDSEASSNLSFTGEYALDNTTEPSTITLTMSNGMAGAGLMRINGDGTMDLNLLFGAPGMVAPPESFDPVQTNPANIAFHLQRDTQGILTQDSAVNIPAEAELAFERNRRLGAGINLNAVVDGNLHPGYERDAPLSDDDIRSIAEAGFRSVRLNVAWSKHCQKEHPYTIDPEFFQKVDGIVDRCIECGLAVSVDVHYYPYINMGQDGETISVEDNFTRLAHLWEQIADHYKGYSDDMLFFDLLNEPNLFLGVERWNELLAELIGVVRHTNPNRTLLISTPCMGQSWSLGSLQLPDDEWNVIVQFHYYLPHTFTHQGLAYALAGDSSGVEWHGTEAERAAILKDFDYCKRWSDRSGRPVNMGEYGVVNSADEASRARYLGFIQEVATQRDISSHLWGYREIFMIRDEATGEWNKAILDALNL